MKADINQIEALVGIAEEADLSEVNLSGPGGRVSFKRIRGFVQSPVPAPASTKEVGEPISRIEEPVAQRVKAPMVGFYRAPKSGLAVGQTVNAGEVVGYIESLSLLNEVSSPATGRVVAVNVEEGAPVQYGQALLEIEEGEEAE